MKELKFTKTATFLFPLLDIPKAFFECSIKDPWGRLKFDCRFLNAYLKHEGNTKYGECHIFIVLRNFRDVDFESFYSTLCAFPNYVDDYDIEDNLIAVFTIPKQNQADFDLLMNGGYSKISSNAKQLILRNNYYSGKPSILPLILNKAESLKESWEERLSNPGSPAYLYDQEVWPIINPESEVLTKNILKSYSQKSVMVPSGEF